MIFRFKLLFVSVYVASGVVSLTTPVKLQNDKKIHASQPTEILPIKPLLLYPLTKEIPYQGRALLKQNKIIYIKLLRGKKYHPKIVKNQITEEDYRKESQMEDIFYVKALANGQFSHNRLKLYRLPEFYAITIYRNGEFNA